MSLLAAAVCASAQNPFMQAFLPRYNVMKQNLLESAEAMPAEHYSFKLTPSQRAFGEWIDHTIMLMHSSCAAAKGVEAPAMDHSAHSGDKPKAELQKALKEAARFCDATFKDMTDAHALGTVTVGGKPVVPANPMLVLLTNMASHYGNMVGYMRNRNVVPPSTARTIKR